VRYIGEVSLQVLAVVFPRLAVHAWCRITFQVIERRPERIDGVDMVQQRGKSHSFLLFGCSPYPSQSHLHARPTLCSERVGLTSQACASAACVWRLPAALHQSA